MTSMKRAIHGMSRMLFLFTITSSLLFACGEGKKRADGKNVKELAAKKKDTASSEGNKKVGDKTFYQVPTPDQMFSIISRIDKDPSKGVLLDTKHAQDIVSSSEQALHLGVYSTDLAYASAFGMGPKALDYFKTVRSLGEQLNVSSAFSRSTIKKIEKSVGKQDSLQNISRETYLDAFKYLERNDRGETLSLLVAGGYTEALYLSLKMVDSYDKKDPMLQYIADQYYGFKNLQLFMEKYNDSKAVRKALKKMQGLQVAFRGLRTKGSKTSELEQKDGKKVLSGGKKLQLGKKDLEKIREEAYKLRNSILAMSKGNNS